METGQWQNRREIKSASSSRIYVVAQRTSDLTWACSCPGWKARRTCKHLTAMGLRSAPATGTSRAVKPAGTARASFSDAAYTHYDPRREGYGSADEWIRIAEDMAGGRRSYRRTGPTPPSGTADLRLLGLTEMPATAKELARAMRRRAFIDHPDHGGTAEAFRTMFAAYERLLAKYPKN